MYYYVVNFPSKKNWNLLFGTLCRYGRPMLEFKKKFCLNFARIGTPVLLKHFCILCRNSIQKQIVYVSKNNIMLKLSFKFFFLVDPGF
jgi:hypothetical protein